MLDLINAAPQVIVSSKMPLRKNDPENLYGNFDLSDTQQSQLLFGNDGRLKSSNGGQDFACSCI